jgi:large subunit ribosomal protein L4
MYMATKTETTRAKKASDALSAVLYTKEGKEHGTVSLPENIFGLPWNAELIHQVTTSMLSNARANTAHVKGRGDVRGGGKKPWRQKGTGRARHGSRRSPLWVGGGTTHGPTSERNYTKKINKKARAKALAVALSQKLRDGQILFVEPLSFTEAKTKTAHTFLSSLAKGSNHPRLTGKKKNAALIALSGKERMAEKSFSNLRGVTVEEARNLNPITVLSSTYLIIENPEKTLKTLTERVA